MGFTAAQQSASGGDGMTQNPSLAALSAAGVLVWLDDLSRNLLGKFTASWLRSIQR
jgi:hypothetical protein